MGGVSTHRLLLTCLEGLGIVWDGGVLGAFSSARVGSYRGKINYIYIQFCNLLAACCYLTFNYPATLLPDSSLSSHVGKLCSSFTGVS